MIQLSSYNNFNNKMMLSRKAILLCFIGTCLFAAVAATDSNDKDPFKSLGIPDLNPKALLNELEQSQTQKSREKSKGVATLRTIDDLPNFLKNSSLNEQDGIKVLTRFLIQDDYTLKKYGVVYDQTGFDGITSGERVAPIGTDERLQQRSRSAANIWVIFE